MILFKNPQNIELFKTFIEQFDKPINELVKIETITICFINEQHKRYGFVGDANEPFVTNTKINNPTPIGMNEIVCGQLKLTQEEIFAMIAHEIGHILDKTLREANNQLERELNADQFAIKLNLSNQLKSGLEKFIESENYKDVVEDLSERIKKLS